VRPAGGQIAERKREVGIYKNASNAAARTRMSGRREGRKGGGRSQERGDRPGCGWESNGWPERATGQRPRRLPPGRQQSRESGAGRGESAGAEASGQTRPRRQGRPKEAAGRRGQGAWWIVGRPDERRKHWRQPLSGPRRQPRRRRAPKRCRRGCGRVFSWAGSPGGWDSRGERRGKPRAVECHRLQADGKTPPLPPCRHGAAPSAGAGITREVPGLGRSGSGTASLFASQMTGHLPPSP